MKRFIKISGIVTCGIIIAFMLIIGIWYAMYIPPYGNKYFDLFIAELFFMSKEERYESSWPPTMSKQLDWEIPTEQFGEGNLINVSLTNSFGKKLYYYGLSPHEFLLKDYVIVSQENIDTLMWNDLSGVFEVGLIPFRKNRKVSPKIENPLLLYPGYPYNLPTDTENFPEIIREVYGDTVQIRFAVCVIEPWKRDFSISYSKYVKIPVDLVINGWEKGNFKRVKYDPESHQEYLEVRRELRNNFKQ